MDGGRVLRALLSYKLGRVEATQIASGMVKAMAFVFFNWLFFKSFFNLIAFFIFFCAYGEKPMSYKDSFIKRT